MTSLKVVCLISGGKDSLFSILHCLKNGHEVVALANLHPPNEDNIETPEDTDSYMYQTVGHAIVPLYESALGLPLYRQEIFGSAVNQNKCYGLANLPIADSEDETEALVPLLRLVKAGHPEINAVSTGAILSDYQRTRVESVAVRLGLTPLSYLWQWPNLPPHTQASLLEDMAAVGQDSRIIKVASGGLDDSFLWQNVAAPHTIGRLKKAAGRFGSIDDGAVLGEGGEYETLAVAGPSPLWKGRIVVDQDDISAIAGDAGSASVQLSRARVETIKEVQCDISLLRTPFLLEDRFQTLLGALSLKEGHTETERDQELEANNMRGTRYNGTVDDSNLHSKLLDHTLLEGLTGEGETPTDQIQSVMAQSAELLQASGHTFSDVAYTTIVLRNMADFASVNAIYGAYFSQPNPPARVTIACASVIPVTKYLTISMTAAKVKSPGARKGLHVQSRSYWAPANIGPYSQAISIPLEGDEDAGISSLVYIAGQIPLAPASMELPSSVNGIATDDFATQTVLALQHVERIGRVMQVQRWICGIAFITSDSSGMAAVRRKIAHQAWEALHNSGRSSSVSSYDDEAETFDVWNIRFGTARSLQQEQYTTADSSARDAPQSQQRPPLHVIRVDDLPRGASIEWVTYGLTGTAAGDPELHHFQHLLNNFVDNIV